MTPEELFDIIELDSPEEKGKKQYCFRGNFKIQHLYLSYSVKSKESGVIIYLHLYANESENRLLFFEKYFFDFAFVHILI